MEQDMLTTLVNSLKLDEEEDKDILLLGGDVRGFGERKLRNCLACKILSSKAMPRDVFRIQLPKILQSVESVNVEMIGTNVFIVEFSSLRDRKRVLTNGPWNLFRNLVIFSELQESSRLTSLNFDSLELWVQVHNIPFSCMNRECAAVIGNHIGKLTEVAMGDKGECWGRFLRIRVVVDIAKPLKRLIRLCLTEGSDPETLILQYERLPTLCFRCGRLGHQIRECLEDAVKDDTGLEVQKFGPWMMANTEVTRQKAGNRSHMAEEPFTGGFKAVGEGDADGPGKTVGGGTGEKGVLNPTNPDSGSVLAEDIVEINKTNLDVVNLEEDPENYGDVNIHKDHVILSPAHSKIPTLSRQHIPKNREIQNSKAQLIEDPSRDSSSIRVIAEGSNDAYKRMTPGLDAASQVLKSIDGKGVSPVNGLLSETVHPAEINPLHPVSMSKQQNGVDTCMTDIVEGPKSGGSSLRRWKKICRKEQVLASTVPPNCSVNKGPIKRSREIATDKLAIEYDNSKKKED